MFVGLRGKSVGQTVGIRIFLALLLHTVSTLELER